MHQFLIPLLSSPQASLGCLHFKQIFHIPMHACLRTLLRWHFIAPEMVFEMITVVQLILVVYIQPLRRVQFNIIFLSWKFISAVHHFCFLNHRCHVSNSQSVVLNLTHLLFSKRSVDFLKIGNSFATDVLKKYTTGPRANLLNLWISVIIFSIFGNHFWTDTHYVLSCLGSIPWISKRHKLNLFLGNIAQIE